MLDFKLISVDDHVNEHPDARARAQREYGDRAPHVVENPPGLGKGLWIIAEGLPPVRSAYFALGHVVEKPEGITQITVMEDRENFRQRIVEFNENFRYDDWPAGREPSARLKDMDSDGSRLRYFSQARPGSITATMTANCSVRSFVHTINGFWISVTTI